MTTIPEDKKIFKSDDTSLSFNERMKLASQERDEIQKNRDNKKRAEAEDVLKTVDKFISEIASVEFLTNKCIESVVKTYSKRKVVELFSFNSNPENGDVYNKTIPSATVDEKVYPTRYILNETYYNLVKHYFPDKLKKLKDLIYEKINIPELNNGVDLETNEKWIVCIFLYKRPGSKFKNGIYISRDGIDYNGNYKYEKKEEK